MRLATEATWTGVAVALVCASSIATSAGFRTSTPRTLDRSRSVAADRCEVATPEPFVVPGDDPSDDVSRTATLVRSATPPAPHATSLAQVSDAVLAQPANRPVLRRSKTPPPRGADSPAH
jgi:hypothetical protein